MPVMNLKHLFFITFAVILIHACKSSDNSLYEFDPRTLEENEITLSEIADEVTYIPLDNKYQLGEIFTIIFINNAIYLNSKNIGILTFDRQGKLISKIGNIGRGPGEYVIYLSFCVDDKSGRVYVADIKDVIKVFSRTGQLIRSFPLKEYGDVIENIGFYNSKLFVPYGIQFKNANYEWIFCDTLGNVIKKQDRHLPIFTTNWGGSEPIYMFENQLSYCNTFTDTVFSILPDLSEKPSIIITPGEHRRPRSNLSLEQFMSKKYLDLDNIFETSRFLVIRYLYKKPTLVLIDKHKQKSFLIYPEYDETTRDFLSGIVNDLDGGSWFLPESYFKERGREYMVGLINPFQIKAYVTSSEFKKSTPKYPEKKKGFEKLANSLNDTDNPVLMMVRLKK
jgi:hypothetical protein